MRIAVFGLGYVGCVSLACLANDGHDVVGVDINPEKIDRISRGLPTIVEPEIDEVLRSAHAKGNVSATSNVRDALAGTQAALICVGTPNSSSGHLDTSAIERVAAAIGEHLSVSAPYLLVLVRSTVPPGTIGRVKEAIESADGGTASGRCEVVANPEFLREASAISDFYSPPVTVVGTDSNEALAVATRIYASVDAPCVMTQIEVAETIKLVNNSWHALKVAFANEIGTIAKALGIDSHALMDLFCTDDKLNISRSYLRPGFAYGGSCLPKDLRALVTLGHDKYLNTPVLQNIERSNELQKNRLVELVLSKGARRIGILGLSFKAGTDDLRNSPIVEVAERLLGKGLELAIFDRNVHLSELTGANRAYIRSHIPHLSELLIDRLQDVIARSQLLILANDEPEFRELAGACRGKTVIDLVRAWQPPVDPEVTYHGIAW